MVNKPLIVAVGSTNATKIDPVKKVFTHFFKHVQVVGVSIPSGVKEQPTDDDEIYKGALNRAKNALNNVTGATYGVGIEGGLHKYNYGWLERSLVVIIDKHKHIGVGSSGGLVLPDIVINKIHQGKTLEQAVDELFGTTKIGEGIGMFGIFTNGVVMMDPGN